MAKLGSRYYFVAAVIGIAIVASVIMISFGYFGNGRSPDENTGQGTRDMECINRLSDKKLIQEGVTAKVPFLVEIAWNPYELRTSDTVRFEVKMAGNETKKPLQNVTYDFLYKGNRDLGIIQDQYVADFSTISADILPIKVNNPCDFNVVIFIDSENGHSYIPDVSSKTEEGSPVLVNFHFQL